jgi:hypothetical protein
MNDHCAVGMDASQSLLAPPTAAQQQSVNSVRYRWLTIEPLSALFDEDDNAKDAMNALRPLAIPDKYKFEMEKHLDDIAYARAEKRSTPEVSQPCYTRRARV